MRKLSIVVFDNADVVVTSSLIQQNLIRHLNNQCQKIFVSCTKMPSKPIENVQNMVEKKLLIDNAIYPNHLQNYFIRCDDGNVMEAKMDVLKTICLRAYDSADAGKVIVFFSVSISSHLLFHLLKYNLIVTFGFHFRKMIQFWKCKNYYKIPGIQQNASLVIHPSKVASKHLNDLLLAHLKLC